MDRLITEDGINIELSEKIPIPLNLSIADFKQPEKRLRNFSKEISIPGTSANQLYFASAFSLTRVGGVYDFNSSEKVNCTYYKNNIAVLRNAVIKLNKVVINDQKKITFKVNVFSDFVDIFLLLSNVSIRDIGWSEYDHEMNNTNITNSWGTPLGQGYYYPLIERQARNNIQRWRNTEMVPYVHFVEVFKKCMEFVGQEYESDYLDTDRAKSILFGFGGGGYVDNAISPAEQNNRLVLTNNGTFNLTESTTAGSTPVSTSGPVYFPPIPFTGNIASNEVQDIYDQMDPVTLTFTAARNGSMRLEVFGQIRFAFSGPDTSFDSVGIRTLYYKKNGTAIPVLDLTQTSADQIFNLNVGVSMDLMQGDVVTLEWGAINGTFTWPIPDDSDTTVILDTTTPVPLDVNFVSTQDAITEGSIIELRRFLPDMKCSDFLVGAIRFRNLMISDPDIFDVVRIEPIRDYYQTTNVFTDISQEVDHSKDIEIRPSANEYAKTLQWKFKKGTEADAMTYEEKYGIPYGDMEFDQSSFFAKGTQKIELPFGTIIPYQLYSNGNGTVIVPRFVDIDDQGVKKPTKGTPRVMFRNGLKPGRWRLRQNSGNQVLFSYPAVHHFDDYENPDFDLNWQLVNEVFYVTNVVTTVNSYSEFYEIEVNEIVSPDGKYVVLYRKMNNKQVKELDWSRLIMWNGALFKFNKVIDFDASITEVTKIELLKILEARNPRRRRIFPPRVFPVIVFGTTIASPPGVGTGATVISGGKNQTLRISNIIQG